MSELTPAEVDVIHLSARRLCKREEEVLLIDVADAVELKLGRRLDDEALTRVLSETGFSVRGGEVRLRTSSSQGREASYDHAPRHETTTAGQSNSIELALEAMPSGDAGGTASDENVVVPEPAHRSTTLQDEQPEQPIRALHPSPFVQSAIRRLGIVSVRDLLLLDFNAPQFRSLGGRKLRELRELQRRARKSEPAQLQEQASTEAPSQPPTQTTPRDDSARVSLLRPPAPIRPVLKRLKIRTVADLLAFDLSERSALKGVGNKKIAMLAELRSQARRWLSEGHEEAAQPVDHSGTDWAEGDSPGDEESAPDDVGPHRQLDDEPWERVLPDLPLRARRALAAAGVETLGDLRGLIIHGTLADLPGMPDRAAHEVAELFGTVMEEVQAEMWKEATTTPDTKVPHVRDIGAAAVVEDDEPRAPDELTPNVAVLSPPPSWSTTEATPSGEPARTGSEPLALTAESVPGCGASEDVADELTIRTYLEQVGCAYLSDLVEAVPAGGSIRSVVVKAQNAGVLGRFPRGLYFLADEDATMWSAWDKCRDEVVGLASTYGLNTVEPGVAASFVRYLSSSGSTELARFLALGLLERDGLPDEISTELEELASAGIQSSTQDDDVVWEPTAPSQLAGLASEAVTSESHEDDVDLEPLLPSKADEEDARRRCEQRRFYVVRGRSALDLPLATHRRYAKGWIGGALWMDSHGDEDEFERLREGLAPSRTQLAGHPPAVHDRVEELGISPQLRSYLHQRGVRSIAEFIQLVQSPKGNTHGDTDPRVVREFQIAGARAKRLP